MSVSGRYCLEANSSSFGGRVILAFCAVHKVDLYQETINVRRKLPLGNSYKVLILNDKVWTLMLFAAPLPRTCFSFQGVASPLYESGSVMLISRKAIVDEGKNARFCSVRLCRLGDFYDGSGHGLGMVHRTGQP